LKGLLITGAFDDEELDEEMIQSHIGRTVGLKLVDGDILLVHVNCFVSVCHSYGQHRQRRVIVIKDKEIASLLYEILSCFTMFPMIFRFSH